MHATCTGQKYFGNSLNLQTHEFLLLTTIFLDKPLSHAAAALCYTTHKMPNMKLCKKVCLLCELGSECETIGLTPIDGEVVLLGHVRLQLLLGDLLHRLPPPHRHRRQEEQQHGRRRPLRQPHGALLGWQGDAFTYLLASNNSNRKAQLFFPSNFMKKLAQRNSGVLGCP